MKTLLHIAITILMTGCVISCFLVPVALLVGSLDLLRYALAYMALSLPFMMMLLEFEKKYRLTKSQESSKDKKDNDQW